MTITRSSIAALTSVALLAGSSLAFARPHRHDLHHPGRAERPAEEHQGATEQHKWGELEQKKAEVWRDKYLGKLAGDRAKRRAHQEAQERKHWGQQMWTHAQVKQEMELDAWRLARIAALRALSLNEHRKDLISKLDALRTREVVRHNRLMDGYRTRWGHR